MSNNNRIVPLVNFIKEYAEIKVDIDEAIKRVLESGWYILGREVEDFEQGFANYLGVDYAIGVASGTDAITLALKALELGVGDGVIVPANVYPSAFGVALSGARLQLADVDPKTLNISVATLEKAVDKSTKAVLVVHLYGNPVDLDDILKFCRDRNIFLIEDCAQATGAEYKGKKVGSFGDVACFSFYPTKNLGAYGDGGLIATNNKDLASKVKLWRTYGEEGRYQSVLIGHNSRLDEIQAAILLTKMKYVDVWNRRRRDIAQKYTKAFAKLPIEVLDVTRGANAVYHLFVIKVEERDKIAQFLKENGVSTGVHYPMPIHITKSFSTLGQKEGDFPVSELTSKNILSLPIYPQMEDSDVDYVIQMVVEAIKV